jgi:hypothetical protein
MALLTAVRKARMMAAWTVLPKVDYSDSQSAAM